MALVICGSMAFEKEMQVISQEMDSMGINTILPEFDNGEIPDSYEKSIKSRLHLSKVVSEETDSILVVNLKKGEKDYHIGANTFAEIAFAWYFGKKVYLYTDIPNNGFKSELTSWNTIPLKGDLSKIIKEGK